MSNYWDLHCRTCKTDARAFHWNHGAPELARFVVVMPVIAQLASTVFDDAQIWFPGSEWTCWRDLTSFMQTHQGHDVRPRSEYGYCDDECSCGIANTRDSSAMIELSMHSDHCQIREP